MSSADRVKMLNIVRDIISQNSVKDKKAQGMRAELDEVYQLVR